MPFMTRIPSDLARFGLTVELVPGWESRGSSSFAPACVVDHWTAGPRGTTGRPSLNIVTNGRPDLDGPLCNVYLDRRGVCVVVAAGRANHAGLGGYRGLLGNSAAYGIEAESAGNDDWTAEQRAAYPRLVAALLSGLQRDATWTCGHNEWAPTRKTDIDDWPMSAMRSQVAASLANPTAQEDDMTPDQAAQLTLALQTVQQSKDLVQSIVDGLYRGGPATGGTPLADQIQNLAHPQLSGAVNVAGGTVDLDALAEKVADKLASRLAS